MKALRVVVVTLVMFLALGVASVYAITGEGQVGLPDILNITCATTTTDTTTTTTIITTITTTANTTACAPALVGPGLFSGTISVIYADGTPVVLSTNKVSLDLCNTSCVTVIANLTQTAPGTYPYSFIPPSSLTGTVTIYIQANGLADHNGRVFPSVDTAIGTYAFTPRSTTTGTSAPIGTSTAPSAGTQVSPLTRQAVNSVQTPTQRFPIGELLAVLSVFALAGCLLILPSRR